MRMQASNHKFTWSVDYWLASERARRARKEGGRSLDIRRILIDDPYAKKAAILIEKAMQTD